MLMWLVKKTTSIFSFFAKKGADLNPENIFLMGIN
jgi:hypothetical protein